MSPSPLLARFAAAAGLSSGYIDDAGTHHEAPPETLRALLTAMGWPAATDAEVRTSFLASLKEEWTALLPPMCVVRPPEHRIPLNLPTADLAATVQWRIALEDGETRSGDAQLDNLATGVSVEIDGVLYGRFLVPLPTNLPLGYHTITLTAGKHEVRSQLAVAPPHAYQPEWLSKGEHVWGVAAHLYSIKSAQNWGVGNFGDLDGLTRIAANQGADMVAISPLHALFPGSDDDVNPYCPSSRQFLNAQYLDMNGAAMLLGYTGDLSRPARDLNDTPEVQYGTINTTTTSALRRMMAHAEKNYNAELEAYVAAADESLKQFALFSALRENFEGRPWQGWPDAFRDPLSPAVAEWAATRQSDIRFHIILQWLCEQELAAAAAGTHKMKVGLVRELAAGVNPNGADVWMKQAQYVPGVRIGTPGGYDWGAAPPNPLNMYREGYASFIATLRANMKYAGALRLDHIAGLERLFWIPSGGSATDGAYVNYPSDDLFGLLALESTRARCMIIGEDSGLLPEGFRQRLERESILSTRTFATERESDGALKRPESYPAFSVAQASTHDMPTIAGFWKARDIEMREQVGLLASGDTLRTARDQHRRRIITALVDQGFMEPQEDPMRVAPSALILAVHRFLALSAAQVVLLNITDVMGMVEQLSLPGATDELYPNWRLHLPTPLETLPQNQYWLDAAATLKHVRETKAPAA